MSYWRKVAAITGKDLISELRTREVFFSALVFAVLVMVVFNFAFSLDTQVFNLIAPGLLWVIFTFTGMLSFNRSFILEKEQGCFEGLLICPVSREVIYLGKMFSSLSFMLLVELVAIPVFTFLFNVSLLNWQIIVITLLATLGFVIVGTLFAALAVNTRAREVVLPVLFLPVVIPIVIAAVQSSALALAGARWVELVPWLPLIAAYDIIFLIVAILTFAFVVEE